MKKGLLISICFSVALLQSCSQSNKETQWRGDKRNGVYSNETGLLKQWPEEGPKLLWSYEELGVGHSSVAIANDKIYITGMIDSTGYLHVFDLQGNLLAKKAYGLEWSANFVGSRSTVTVNDGKLYFLSGRAVLFCVDENTLETVWSKDYLTDFDGSNLKFGIAESPLVVGELVYATPGGKVNNFVALNKNTGDLVWSSSGVGKLSTYCSPLYISELEIPIVVNAIDSVLVGFNAQTGEMLWAVEQKNSRFHNPNTPLYENGFLFGSAGGGFGSIKVRLTNGGRGIDSLWRNEMDNKMGGFVKVGDYVYGSGEKNRFWYCIDWNTGETVYKSDKLGAGNIISADGMLYCYSDKGELALVKASPKDFEITGKLKVTLGTEQHWAHPVIHNKTLYVRHGNALMAYKI
ncbi:polyvinylalcohol dehydrogenase [Bacteroidia bacterium]|nr:polyvinylalcohol dehydrogenase [Bacteroidia bacterium]